MTGAIILQFLSEQSVLGFLQLIVGKLIKNNPSVPNIVIPWVTLLLSILGYTVAPASAQATGALSPLMPALNVGLMAILQTVMITGVHSFSKNSIGPLLSLGLRAAALKIIGGKS